ncbi:MAG: HAD family hydrolase [Myxococcota bacterium]
MLRALVLDLGNVLAFHDNALLFRRLAERAGKSAQELHRAFDGELGERINKGKLPGDTLRLEICRRLGMDISPPEFFELWNCHFTLNTPMVSLVESLVGRVKLFLLSNTHDLHFAWLRPRLPVLARFDGLLLSYELELAKPEPAIFREAVRRAGVAPGEVAFFDDVSRYVEAARREGLCAHVFTTVENFRAQLARDGLALGSH